ncbi:hypothetical protein MPSEU_000646400 [Mayamaea pseudoterrestris]|nr:hypothetical protein MPSEU_000646400 [Mayamaea pseudoterrestris]
MKTMANLRSNSRNRPESAKLESVKEEFATAMFGSSRRNKIKGHSTTLSQQSSMSKTNKVNLASKMTLEKNIKGKKRQVDWHKEVMLAIQSGRWEALKGFINVYNTATTADEDANKPKKKKSFWKRMHKVKEEEEADPSSSQDQDSLLRVDQEGRTPLHVALSSRKTPLDVLLMLIRAEPRACQVLTDKRRYPLHFAILGRHHVQVIAELVKNFPEALSASDAKHQTPLAYAFAMAKKQSKLEKAPKNFWMATGIVNGENLGLSGSSAHSNNSIGGGSNHSLESRHRRRSSINQQQAWQTEQIQAWGIVHWLLLSLATNSETHLSVGEGVHQKPMLVDALLHAAPPSVVALLIGASARLLMNVDRNNRATAFAGSTLYSCLARHYPLSILQSLASQCPKDVRLVRDETGMGLVSAHYVSGCFSQSRVGEWKVNVSFVDALAEATETKQLPIGNNPGFCEWWQKMEYLILFCGCDEEDYKVMSKSKEFLLHAALVNSDIPPSIIRLLLALYSSSIHHAHPLSGALPIHIAATCPDYIPRNYEFQTMNAELSALAIVLHADPSAIQERQNGRLPLHLALAANKQYSSIHMLLEEDLNVLSVPDPISGLLPFMHASALRGNDEFRYSCVARNKYSHAVWKGLNDRQKSTAIQRVAETDSLERTDTIFRLLRINVSAFQKTTISMPVLDHPSSIVRKHFWSWCFDEHGNNIWILNTTRTRIFEQALQKAKETHSFDELQIDKLKAQSFARWWHKMKFWIRYCIPRNALDAYKDMPCQFSDEYLLHAALANSKNTPPQLIELILALFPNSVQLSLPGHSMLPLHIACSNESYFAFPFEKSCASAVDLILKAYPSGANVASDDGVLPLHLAINSDKTASTIILIATEAPRSLKVQDYNYLFPFQMVAAQRTRSAEENQQLQIATGTFNLSTCEWEALPTNVRAANIRSVQLSFDRMQLNCIFELLRKGADVIRTSDRKGVATKDIADESQKPPRCECHTAERIEIISTYTESEMTSVASQSTHSSSSAKTHSDSDDSEEDEVDENEDDDSEDTEATRTLPFSTASQPSSLMRLLSREKSNRKMDAAGGDLFDCDHSVFSAVDVMSSISKSYHSASKKNRSQSGTRSSVKKRHQPDSEDLSLQMSDLGRPHVPYTRESESDDESTVVDDLAADEADYQSASTWGDESRLEDKYDSDASSSDFRADSDSDVQGSDSEDSDFEGLIYFQMRRPTRLRGTLNSHEQLTDVKLTKKDEPIRKTPGRTRSLPVNRSPSRADSLRRMLISDKPNSARNVLENIEGIELAVDNGDESPRSKRKTSEQSSIPRSHSPPKEVDTEELLGKSFANMRMAAATKPKRGSKSNVSGERNSGTDRSLSLESYLEPGSPSEADNKRMLPPSQSIRHQSLQNLLPSLSTHNGKSSASLSSEMTGSVSTIQLLEYSRSNDDSANVIATSMHKILDHKPPCKSDSESSSEDSVPDFMIRSVRSHIRGTGHRTDDGTDHLSTTDHTFSESAQSFFEESTSSDYNHNLNNTMPASALRLTSLSEGCESPAPANESTSAESLQISDTVEDDNAVHPSTQCQQATTSASKRLNRGTIELSDLSLTSRNVGRVASFDKNAFKWVFPTYATNSYETSTEHSTNSTKTDDEVDDGQHLDSFATPVTGHAAPREKGSYNVFKSLTLGVGLPKSEKDSASWLREHMASEASGMTCLLCNQRRSEVLLVPCHHLSLCKGCSVDNPDMPCPLCNLAATSRIEIQI